LVTVPPTVSVVPEIEDAVPEALEIEGSLLIPVPENEELHPLIPFEFVPDDPAPPPPTMIV
jgi:hypothetical protein